MEVEAVRFVDDRFEWSSLTKETPSIYHLWEWSEQSRRRVQRQLPTRTVDSAYLRIWVHDSMIGCPVIHIDGIWYNTPRSSPLTLVGEPIDPFAVFDALDDDVFLIDDSEQIDSIAALSAQLGADADSTRSRRSIAPSDIEAMRRQLVFPSADASEIWFEGVEWAWRTGWDTTLVEYRRAETIIGWTVEVHRQGAPAVVAAARCDQIVPEWTSPR